MCPQQPPEDQPLEAQQAAATSNINKGIVAAKKQDFSAAAIYFRKAIECKFDELQAYINLGRLAFIHTNYLQEGMAALKQATELAPGYAEPYYMLAKLYELSNDLSTAEEYLNKGLALEPDHPHSHRLFANIKRRQGKIDEAIARLESAPIAENDPGLAIYVHFELGRLYERKQDSALAYAHYLKANQLQSQTPQAQRVNKQAFFDIIDRIHQTFTPEWLATWSAPYEARVNDRPDPIFLVGFPRSGTTLLDQILSSHPALQVIEEQAMLVDIQNELVMQGDYPALLATLDQSEIHVLRQKYFASADHFLESGQGKNFVDKLPLSIINVGLIMRLFPGAQIILALRHPCDVCLSCFMQSFGYNEAMANYYTLEDSARLYARVMGLWQHFEALLPLSYHRIKYEDVVNDLEGEARKLLKFLELEWDDKVLTFSQLARSRERIRTPSYEQVSEKIYTRARYRWHRYEEQLSPVMPLLTPFIDTFGYREDK